MMCETCGVPHDEMEWRSRGMLCGRCRAHTGNNHQGHYWAFCLVTGAMREHHFCCPGNCQLEAGDG